MPRSFQSIGDTTTVSRYTRTILVCRIIVDCLYVKSIIHQKEYNLFYQVPRIGTRMNSTKENRHRQTNQTKIRRKYHMVKLDENIVYDTQ